MDPVFKIIRDADGLTESKILESLNLDYNLNAIFKVGLGAGKSGSFFFHSHDRRLIIKTVTGGEKALLKAIIKSTARHVTRPEGSILSRIYGLFSISSSQFSKMSFILLQNVI